MRRELKIAIIAIVLVLMFVMLKFDFNAVYTGEAIVTAYGVCGDNTVDSGETCDDGNTVTEACGDGTTHSGSYCNSDCSLSLSLSETCDDSNVVSGDGCSSTCKTETDDDDDPVSPCGDGGKSPSEECDDGNKISGDGCSSACKLETVSQCNDDVDNDGDSLIDENDPGCWTDSTDSTTYSALANTEIEGSSDTTTTTTTTTTTINTSSEETITTPNSDAESSSENPLSGALNLLKRADGGYNFILIGGIGLILLLVLLIIFGVVRKIKGGKKGKKSSKKKKKK
jgi:cysteine-rich repeat protein